MRNNHNYIHSGKREQQSTPASEEAQIADDMMETDKPKYSNSQLRKIQAQWTSRRKKRKHKRLGGKQAHSKW